MRIAAALIALAGLAGGQDAVQIDPPPPSEAEPDRLSTGGIGAIRIGISVQKLMDRFAASAEFIGDDKNPMSCAYFKVPRYPELGFMVIDGRLARIDSNSPPYLTASGVHVGQAETEVLATFGSKIRIDDHPYLGDQGKYLVFTTGDGQSGMIAETNNEAITSYRIGRWDAVQFIEGCS